MTKEELEKEAEEWIKDHSGLVGSYMFVKYDYDSMQKAYLASAEPREKQITGLSKHILELQKDKGNLTYKVNELEKRCANYEMTISKMEKGTCDICKETEKDKKIEALEQQIEKMKCCYNCSKWYDGECEESPKSKTFFCADFKCDNWEIAYD